MTWEKRPAKTSARMRGYVSASWTDTNSAGRLRTQQRALLRQSERPVERVCGDRLGIDATKVQERVYTFGDSTRFYLENREFTAEERAGGYFGIRPIFSAGD